MREEEIIQQIDRYCRGELSTEEADRLWEELVKEPDYMKLLEAEVAARRYFEKKGKQLTNEEHDASRHGGGGGLSHNSASGVFSYGSGAWVAGAAVLILIVLLTRSLMIDSPQLMTEQVVSTISIEQMETPKVMRSESGDESYNPLDVEITRGYKAALSGKEQESIESFRAIMQEAPEGSRQMAMASFNSGILYYNLAEYETAADRFTTVTELDPAVIGHEMAGKGWWYLGQSHVKLNAYTQARQSILQAMSLNSSYQEEANLLLPGLERKIARQQ